MRKYRGAKDNWKALFVFLSIILGSSLLSGSVSPMNWSYSRYDPQNTNFYPAPGTKINTQVWSEFTGDGIASTPLVIDNRVYVSSFDGYLYCYDALSGSLIWKARVTIPYTWITHRGGIEASPVYLNGLLYVLPRDGGISCVRADTGIILWNITIGNFTLITPTVVDSRYLVFPDVKGNLYVFDVNNLTFVKDIFVKQLIWSKPAYDGKEYLYVGTGGGEILKIDKNGWKIVGSVKLQGGVTGAVVYYNGLLFVGTNFGYLYCISAKDLRIIWTFKAFGPIIGGPSIGRGTVFFASEDTYVYALDEKNGQELWATALKTSSSSAIAVSESYLYVFDDNGNLYCINTTTGVVLWSSDVFGDARYQVSTLLGYYFPKGVPNVAIYGQNVYAGLLDGRVICIGTGEYLSINPLFLYLSVFAAVFFVVIIGSKQRRRKKKRKRKIEV